MINFIKGFHFRAVWDKYIWPHLKQGIVAIAVSILTAIAGKKSVPAAI